MKKSSVFLSKVIVIVLVLITMFTMIGCGAGTVTTPAESASKDVASSDAASVETSSDQTEGAQEKFKIALSNSYVGNEWRQGMQKLTEYVAQNLYADSVDFKVVNCENTPEAQSASIDALTLEGYDAILLLSCSSTALDQAIQRAIAQNVVVVSFDMLVDSENIYKLSLDWYQAAYNQAKYLAEAIDGKGKVVVDRGLAGADGASDLYQGALDAFAEYPDIEIAFEFDGNFSEGDTLSGMEAAIAACEQIDAVYTQGHVVSVIKALNEAGRALVPISGWGYNSSLVALAENNCDGICAHNSPGSGAKALEMAVSILNGETKYNKDEIVEWPCLYFAANPDTVDLGVTVEKVELGVNAFPEKSAGFHMAWLPDEIAIDIPDDLFD